MEISDEEDDKNRRNAEKEIRWNEEKIKEKENLNWFC